MKILHTADWHIGKKLHKHDLSEDFDLFIQWLGKTIKQEEVDVVLISGDIFDLANPSSEARRAYYLTLVKLQNLNCQVIITGGNHDSPAVLNAPRELLQAMNIHVVGNMPAESADCLIPIKDKQGNVEAVVAAIPYLRDPDLRQATEDHSYESRVEAIREGIARTFQGCAESCKTHYPGIPAIAMGHLFAAGVTTSESERDIQFGNEASFNAEQFGSYFSYLALGHIHRPQKVGAPVPAYYSGSPVSLSFSEREDQKRVLIIDTEDFQVRNVDIPVFRRLKRVSGDLAAIKSKIGTLEPEGELAMLLELEMIEEHYDPGKITDLEHLAREFDSEGAVIVKHRATFKNKLQGASELYAGNQQLEELKPREVFEKRLEREQHDEETKSLIREAFDEILEETQNQA